MVTFGQYEQLPGMLLDHRMIEADGNSVGSKFLCWSRCAATRVDYVRLRPSTHDGSLGAFS